MVADVQTAKNEGLALGFLGFLVGAEDTYFA